MDLGIKGRKAIVCASSRGLGKACAFSLAREGCDVVVNGRDAETLAATAEEIRSKFGGTVIEVVADMDAESGRAALLDAMPEPDILVNNNGGPPPGMFMSWGQEEWQKALNSNMLAPLLLIRAVLDGMRTRKFGRIINITSAMVKTPHVMMGLSVASRTGLTAMCRALAREVAADNITINNILPERFETARHEAITRLMMTLNNISYEKAVEDIIATIAARRLGQPEEFGDACAYLCSAQAGYISGQNLQMDGGSYAGLI